MMVLKVLLDPAAPGHLQTWDEELRALRAMAGVVQLHGSHPRLPAHISLGGIGSLGARPGMLLDLAAGGDLGKKQGSFHHALSLRGLPVQGFNLEAVKYVFASVRLVSAGACMHWLACSCGCEALGLHEYMRVAFGSLRQCVFITGYKNHTIVSQHMPDPGLSHHGR